MLWHPSNQRVKLFPHLWNIKDRNDNVWNGVFVSKFLAPFFFIPSLLRGDAEAASLERRSLAMRWKIPGLPSMSINQ